jgi:hypothetical protein
MNKNKKGRMKLDTIDVLKHNLAKKREKRSRIKMKDEKRIRIKSNPVRYFTPDLMQHKDEAYYTEEEMLKGYLAPSYESLSESEKTIYNESSCECIGGKIDGLCMECYSKKYNK